MKETLNWNNILNTCRLYNIPPTAKIELATGWECGKVPANEIYYSIADNTLYFVSEGCEYWFEKPDIIHLDLPTVESSLF